MNWKCKYKSDTHCDVIEAESILCDEGTPFKWWIEEDTSGVTLHADKELMRKSKKFRYVTYAMRYVEEQEQKMCNFILEARREQGAKK